MNKIIFSGLVVLVCCLFGEVGVVNGETDISGQCISISVSAGDNITPNDICYAAGYGSCRNVGTRVVFHSDDSCTAGLNAPAIANCNGLVSPVADSESVKPISLICDIKGWGILTPPKNVPEDFSAAAASATNWLLGFVSMLAVLMIIWGGINYLTAAGDEEKARTAKKIITYGIMGVVIAGLAYAIVTVIVTVILK